MGVLERVSQMQSQGKPEEEIKQILQEEGISPKEINDAFSQSKIKNAVSNTEDMQPSIMSRGDSIPKPNDIYTPKTQEVEQEDLTLPQEEELEQYNNYEQSPQENYSQENYGDNYFSENSGSDLMIEISEQVFSKKIREIKKQIDIIDETKELMKVKIDDTINRINRIENTLDKLQIAILEKVGSYGTNLDSIKKEMSMMQDSFKKVVNKAVSKPIKKTAKKVSKKK